jgi:hypothetical protein
MHCSSFDFFRDLVRDAEIVGLHIGGKSIDRIVRPRGDLVKVVIAEGRSA